MKVLKATLVQKNALEGVYSKGTVLQFIEDVNKEWVVNKPVLQDDNFIEIRAQLLELEEIEYLPKATPPFIHTI